MTSSAASPDPGSSPAGDPRRFAAAAVGGLAALAAVKFWPLLRPWERAHFGGDLTLGVEGHFFGLLKRGVVLGPGPHEVVFSFRYPIFYVGLGLTAAGWAGVAVILRRSRRRAG